MNLQDYILAKTELTAVKLSLEVRRNEIVQRRNPKNADVIADLTDLIKLVDRCILFFVEMEKENAHLVKLNASLKLELAKKDKEISELKTRCDNLEKNISL